MVCDQSDSLATETVAGRSRRQEKETSGAMQSTMLTRGLDGKNRIGHIPPVPDCCRSRLSASDLAWRYCERIVLVCGH